MLKRILVCGLSGGVVLLAWTTVLNVGFRFSHRVQMRHVANERDVYAVLKANIAQPGAYVLNPPPDPGVGFAPGEPVFGVQYSGIGHDAAGAMLLLELAIGFVAPVVVAAMLSMAAASVLSRYLRKLLFVAMIGFVIAVFGDLQRFGIGGYPFVATLLLVARDLVGWFLAGLVMAWLMKPVAEPAPAS